MRKLICWCGTHYDAKEADLKRGWAFSCCKSHAAIKRDYGRSNPVDAVTGKHINDVKKKHKQKRYTPDKRVYTTPEKELQKMHEEACYWNEVGWDGHKNTF